jgi:hypothetical protein
MKNNFMLLKKYFFLLLCSFSLLLNAQLKIGNDIKNIDTKSYFEVESRNGNIFSVSKDTLRVGIGTASSNSSSILSLESTSMGFLPPRMTQSQRNANIALPATGLVIYCTDCNSGSGCLQVNDGTPAVPSWNCLTASSSPAVSAICNGFTGNYYASNALSGTTYTVTMTNNSFSSATIAFATTDLVLSGVVSGVNVVSVSPTSQTLTSGQTATITYTLSGTPSTIGTLTGTWTKLSLNCSKSTTVTYRPPTVNCNAITTTSNNYTLTNGSSYSGTITVPYTGATVGATYPAEILIQNGLTLSRAAGTYATATGNVTYSISGSYIGVSNNSVSFTFDQWAGGCTVLLFDAIRQAIVTGGNTTDLSRYDAAALNGVVSITATSYNAIANMNGAGRILATESYMGGGVSNGGCGSSSTWAYTSGAFGGGGAPYFTAGRYVVAFSLKSKTPSVFSGSSKNISGAIMKMSSTVNSGYSDYTGAFPSVSISDQTRYYFVIKRPSGIIPNTPFMAIYMQDPNNDIIGTGNGSVGTVYTGSGNTNSPSGAGGVSTSLFFQAIEVSTKQW